MLRVGILGVGAIGQTIATALDRRRIDATLVGLADQDRAKAENFAVTLKNPAPVLSLDTLVQSADLIVEAASQEALLEIVPRALAQGKDLLIMSGGGLLGREDWFRLARERGCRIYVPSGALAGLDGLKAASVGAIQSVTLTSRKPVAALQGAKYVVERGLPLESLKEETVVFEGSAKEASQAFPATANVAAAVSLVVGDRANVRVKIIAVPGGCRNIHEVMVEGEFGRLHVAVENVPSEANPRTSKLAALSALAALEGITRSLRVGT